MPSDATWTSLITGATGVLTGLVGYGAARLQPAFEARRSSADQARADRESRRTLYLEYLAAVDEVSHAYHRNLATEAWHTEWWGRFTDVDNRLELLGSSDVREASYPLYDALVDIWADARPDDLDRKAFQEAFDTVYASRREAVEGNRRKMLDAMRHDVQDTRSA